LRDQRFECRVPFTTRQICAREASLDALLRQLETPRRHSQQINGIGNKMLARQRCPVPRRKRKLNRFTIRRGCAASTTFADQRQLFLPAKG
jgi:hypothetical protein